MRATNDFFKQQAEQCHALAARAGNKGDREFWLGLAHRWERLLQGGDANSEAEQQSSFDRPLFRKKSALAKRFAKKRAA
jgi:hypothetical protein